MEFQTLAHFLNFTEVKKCEASREWAKLNYLPTRLSSELSGSSSHNFKNQPELLSLSEENGLLLAVKLLT